MDCGVHLLTPEYPPAIGGVAAHTRQLARALAENGEDVHVWCPAGGKAQPSDLFAVRAELGAFGARDLARAGVLLDRFAAPRRLLVQWVPHGYGQRSMNVGFCSWIRKRAAAGDQVELMVHEPFLSFWEGNLRQTAAAAVHRLMTVMLLGAARKVWVSIPAWEQKLRPYAMGRSVAFQWLPIPSALPYPDPKDVEAIRRRLDADNHPIVGHFGTFGSLISSLLRPIVAALVGHDARLHIQLIGAGSERFRAEFGKSHARDASKVTATGVLGDAALSAQIAACDVLVQPYPDGVSSRRTTVMAALKLGVPVITTQGALTEDLWSASGAVGLASVGDVEATAGQIATLLNDVEASKQLRKAGRDLYLDTFDLPHVVRALRSRAPQAVAS